MRLNSPVPKSWCFLQYNDTIKNTEHLLLSTEEGIYEIKDDKFYHITGSEPVYVLYQSVLYPQYVYFGTLNIFGILEYKDGSFVLKGKIPGTGISIRSILEEKSGIIWLSTFRQDVYKIIPTSDILSLVEIKKYGMSSGLPSLKNILIYEIEGRTSFATEKGIYHYDDEADKFYPDENFKDLFSSDTKDVFIIKDADSQNLWMTQLYPYKGSTGKAVKEETGQYIWESEALNMIPEMLVLTLYSDAKTCLWVGGSEGLFHYNTNNKLNFNKINRVFLR